MHFLLLTSSMEIQMSHHELLRVIIRIENRMDGERLYYFDDFYLIENENAPDTSQCWDGASPNPSNPSDSDSASSSLLLFIGLLLLFII